MIKTCFINGEPVAVLKYEQERSNRLWSEYRLNKCKYDIQIENQEPDEPVKQQIDLEVVFYVSRQEKEPSIIDMLKFINRRLEGHYYKKETQIQNIVLKKIVTDKPHTEIRIYEENKRVK